MTQQPTGWLMLYLRTVTSPSQSSAGKKSCSLLNIHSTLELWNSHPIFPSPQVLCPLPVIRFKKMAELLSIFLMVFSSSLLLYCVFRAAYTVWWVPMKLDKQLKQQGVKGSPYKLLIGDYKELGRSMKEAWSRPMDLTHQIVPRALPFLHENLQKHGMVSPLFNFPLLNSLVTWFVL